MTENALTVVDGAQKAMMMPATAMDYGLIDQWLDETDGGSDFPGNQVIFRKGRYYDGWGKAAPRLPDGVEFVANIPNLVFGWRTFEGGGRPVTLALAYPAKGEKLRDRREFGRLEEQGIARYENGETGPVVDDQGKRIPGVRNEDIIEQPWPCNLDEDESNKQGKDVYRFEDPYQQFAVLVLRDQKTNELRHLMTTSWSANKAIKTMLRQFAKEGRQNPGKLPVIALDSDEETRKGTSISYWVPKLDIVGWVAPVEADSPAGGVAVAAPSSAPVPEVTQAKPAVEQRRLRPLN